MSTFSSSRLALAGSSPPLSGTADGLHRRCERPSRARQKIVVVRCDAGTGAGWSFFRNKVRSSWLVHPVARLPHSISQDPVMSTFSSKCRLALAGSLSPLTSRPREAASPDLPGPCHVDILLKMPSRSHWLSSPPPLWTAEWPGRARDRRSLSSDCNARTGAELLP
ncbi:hypothetical protein ACEPAI_8210 [Sanghuangporus weigelae]